MEILDFTDMLFDTGCNLTYTSVLKLLRDPTATRIFMQGISKKPEVITTIGKLNAGVRDEYGRLHRWDDMVEQVAYKKGSPLNLLAASTLLGKGAIVHLEEGNCYLRTRSARGALMPRIPIREVNGLYVIRLEHLASGGAIKAALAKEAAGGVVDDVKDEVMVDGVRLVQAVSMDLAHRRLNHSSPAKIQVMYDKGLAEGLVLERGKYKHDKNCNCDTCKENEVNSGSVRSSVPERVCYKYK